MPRVSRRIHLNVQHPARDGAPVARRREARILNRVLKREQHAWDRPKIALVDQDGAPLQQVTMTLQRGIQRRVEQRMPRAQERGERLSWR